METMYWIDVLGNISTVTTIVASLLTIVTLVAAGLMFAAYGSDDDESASELKKWVKSLGVCVILFTLAAVFTPSTKSMYMIYGVGGTIDYLKENKTAKQLPDKVVMALDKWVDSQIEDESKDKDN